MTDTGLFRTTKLLFGLAMILGYAMRPELIKENKGVSNFWFKKRSLGFLVGGFLFSALSTIILLRAPTVKKSSFRLLLWLRLACVLGVLFTSPLLRTKRGQIHYVLGGAMFTVQLLISIALLSGKRGRLMIGLLVGEALGALISLISAATKIQLMFIGQVLAQGSYLFLILTRVGRSLSRLASSKS